MLSQDAELKEIYDSLINGQQQQMVKQIKAYGLHDFWADFAEWLKENFTTDTAYSHFRDATISYFRITNR